MAVTHRVLVVDEDDDIRDGIAGALEARGFETESVTSVENAMARLRSTAIDVVITDLDTPGADGLTLSRHVSDSVGVPVILMVAEPEIDTAIAAIRADVYDYLVKPVEVRAVAIAVERALRDRALADEVKRLREEVASTASTSIMIGDSKPMLALKDLIRRVARADVSVLVTGESGTGKELVARALHEGSDRSDGPFVAVNCAAVPEQLLESELFGVVKGAFTDAKENKPGLLLRSSSGTLFLDEIGEMPVEMQSKLLRVLQERRVRPVGSTDEIEFDVRLITATNRDLEEEVDDGRFREDLYYRINVVQVSVPPLRQRGSDVLLLAQHFISTSAERLERPVRGLNEAAAQDLLAYDWPGNVRELENYMERGVALARYDAITPEDLPAKVRQRTPSTTDEVDAHETPLLTLEELERKHIVRVVEAVDGNKSQAARILGVDRRTLYRKAERYGLEI